MMVFAAVLKNNIMRLAENKARLLLFLFLTACSIAAALFINASADNVGYIAVVSNDDITLPTEFINIIHLEEAPPMSELVAGKYGAAVIFDERGGHEIRTVRNEEFKQTLEALITNPAEFTAEQIGSRGSGTNIVGFMMMFILMQGVSMTFMFAEDKEKKQIKRIAASPVSFSGYLSAHSFFTFAALLAPVIAMLTIVRFAFNIGIGFGIPKYLFVISLLCFFATAFALFLISFIKKSDSANMVGSAVIVLTSILSGGFYSFDKGNKILEAIIKVLPQKSFLTMSELLEQGKDITLWYPHATYILALSIFFLAASVIKTRKEYVNRG